MENSQVLPCTVFPSEETSITVLNTDDEYGGCHTYSVKGSLGFNNGKAEYSKNEHIIQFVRKNTDGSMIDGFQNEQLYYICADRLIKMNTKYPDPRNEQMLEHLNALLVLCKERVQDRINRNVMGELKK